MTQAGRARPEPDRPHAHPLVVHEPPSALETVAVVERRAGVTDLGLRTGTTTEPPAQKVAALRYVLNPVAFVRAVVAHSLIRNGGYILATTVVTSALGYLY